MSVDARSGLSDLARAELRSQVAQAFETHHAWIGRVEDAIVSGMVTEDLADVAREDRCQIGRWLTGAISEELRETPLYKVTKGRHAAFHRALADVLAIAQQDREEDARASLADDGEFGQAAARIREALAQWLRMAG